MAKKPKARKPAHAAVAKRPAAMAPRSNVGELPRFSFEYADRTFDGPWGFHEDEASSHHVMGILCDMGKLKWSEIYSQMTGGKVRRKKHHYEPVDGLCDAARQRIADLHLDEVFDEQIFRFRDGGTGRLWGYVLSEVFYVLWWDPDHQVHPV